MHRVDHCKKCGEERELAAFGLCFMCYRQQERASNRIVDRHNPGIRSEQYRLVSGYCQVLKALSMLGINKDDIVQIQAILAPYLQPVENLLRVDSDRCSMDDLGKAGGGQ